MIESNPTELERGVYNEVTTSGLHGISRLFSKRYSNGVTVLTVASLLGTEKYCFLLLSEFVVGHLEKFQKVRVLWHYKLFKCHEN